MDNKLSRFKALVLLAIVGAAVSTLSMLFVFGCTKTLDGEMNANQKPIVYFVNIPPEGQRFSRNPEVYWVGLDNDGQIDYYRYFVARVDDIGAVDPLDFVQALDDTMWVYLDVDPLVSDPQTKNTISLEADLGDPVNTFVAQYVFVQAFDDDGAASDVAYRIFNRNDNPPETRIYSVHADTPFVNSVFEGGIITGVRLRWEGSDRRDYEEQGLEPPPFEFEWRLYGPYTDQELQEIDSLFLRLVFVTEDARVFFVGDTLIRCDTFLVDTNIGGVDTTIFVDSCDTVIFDSETENTPFYTSDRLLLVDSSMFTGSGYYRLITTSWNGVDTWVTDESDTIYNVYRHGAPDTTVQLNCIFWARSRDDALVADLTPEFVSFGVINPKYERDIAVIDFTDLSPPFFCTYVDVDTAKTFWLNALKTWNPALDFDTSFFDSTYDPRYAGKTGQDYIMNGRYSGGIPIALLLKHKLLILYNEDVRKSGFVSGSTINNPEIPMAIDAGINVWATWRAPIAGGLGAITFYPPVPTNYMLYFGVTGIVYSNWFWQSFGGTRIEDFVGAYSVDESQWPSLDLDSTLLHQRFSWNPPFATWIDSIAALPEVDWCERLFGTEVMYLYKSRYGPSHPLGFQYSFDGSPVAHRRWTSLYRTVHFNFTMLAVEEDKAQQVVNSVLDWLYEPIIATPTAEVRYPDAPVKISVSEARRQYLQRIQECYDYREGL